MLSSFRARRDRPALADVSEVLSRLPDPGAGVGSGLSASGVRVAGRCGEPGPLPDADAQLLLAAARPRRFGRIKRMDASATAALRTVLVAVALAAAVPGARSRAADAFPLARMEDDARLTVQYLLGDLSSRAAFRNIRSYRRESVGGEGAAVCGEIAFADPLAGSLHFVALYGPEHEDWREAEGEPTFFWPDVPTTGNAAYCTAAESHAHRNGELRPSAGGP